MVQEFHVLKCYSCEAFQVHQVKKSPKWNCKMCGEKQSIIKVFGRGSGSDCRRHVQKLNTRRGEMLEEQNQKVWSRWEEADARANDEELEDAAQGYDGQDAGTATVAETQGSRWSKYLQKQSDVDPPEEEEEEEDIHMVRDQRPGFRNVRKRKRVGGDWEGGNAYQSAEEDTFLDSWRTVGRSSKPPAHQNNRHSSSFTPMEKSSKALAPPFRPVPAYDKPPSATPTAPSKPAPSTSTIHKPPLNAATVPNRLNTATSQPGSSLNTTVSQTSRWAQFLTTPSPAEEEEEEDEDHQGFGATRNHEYQVEDYTKALTGQAGGNTWSSLATLGDGGFLGTSVGTTLNRLQSAVLCGFGKAANSEVGPPQTAPCEGEEPVCHQPPPTKLPCSSLSVGSLFYTDEDFDDTF